MKKRAKEKPPSMQQRVLQALWDIASTLKNEGLDSRFTLKHNLQEQTDRLLKKLNEVDAYKLRERQWQDRVEIAEQGAVLIRQDRDEWKRKHDECMRALAETSQLCGERGAKIAALESQLQAAQRERGAPHP